MWPMAIGQIDRAFMVTCWWMQSYGTSSVYVGHKSLPIVLLLRSWWTRFLLSSYQVQKYTRSAWINYSQEPVALQIAFKRRWDIYWPLIVTIHLGDLWDLYNRYLGLPIYGNLIFPKYLCHARVRFANCFETSIKNSMHGLFDTKPHNDSWKN